MRIKPNQIYKLSHGVSKVEVIGVKQGEVFYCRVGGSGVIHKKMIEDFLLQYVNCVEDSARKQFDKELEDLLNGNEGN